MRKNRQQEDMSTRQNYTQKDVSMRKKIMEKDGVTHRFKDDVQNTEGRR